MVGSKSKRAWLTTPSQLDMWGILRTVDSINVPVIPNTIPNRQTSAEREMRKRPFRQNITAARTPQLPQFHPINWIFTNKTSKKPHSLLNLVVIAMSNHFWGQKDFAINNAAFIRIYTSPLKALKFFGFLIQSKALSPMRILHNLRIFYAQKRILIVQRSWQNILFTSFNVRILLLLNTGVEYAIN